MTKDLILSNVYLNLWRIVVGVGVIIVGIQALLWLDGGLWIPVTITNGLEFAGFSTYDIYNPTKLIGLHKIIQWLLDIPLWIALILPGWVGVIFSKVSIETIRDKK